MDAAPLILGRYALHGAIASGGMATVHIGRLVGAVGFSRMVAIKRLHPHYAKDPSFVDMFVDEARLAARIQHPNIVSTLDVVTMEGELFVVMQYVEGESVSQLIRAARDRDEHMPVGIAVSIATGMLDGLHAAHEAVDERGRPLDVVHRDVSPQNVLVGVDGIPRVIDFGIAKATGRLSSTREGQLKGKLAYMAPEQLDTGSVDRRTDVYAASAVLWEALAGRRLFPGATEGQVVTLVLRGATDPPSKYAAGVPAALDAIVMRGLATNPADRFATAQDMAFELERTTAPAVARDVGEWVRQVAGKSLAARAAMLEAVDPKVTSPTLRDQTAPTVREAEDAASTRTTLPLRAVAEPGASTTVSSTKPAVLATRQRHRVVPFAALGTAVLAGTTMFVLWNARQAPLAPAPPSTAVLAAAMPPPDPPSVVSPSESVSVAPPRTPPPATGSAAPSATPGRTPPRGASTPSPGPRATAASCIPPYTVDANGVHTFKRECVGAK